MSAKVYFQSINRLEPQLLSNEKFLSVINLSFKCQCEDHLLQEKILANRPCSFCELKKQKQQNGQDIYSSKAGQTGTEPKLLAMSDMI